MTTDIAGLEAAAQAMLESPWLTAPTRRALAARLEWRPASPRLLHGGQMAVLEAVAKRLIPLGDLDERLCLAARFEAAVAGGPSDGWRYAQMPADADALCGGLDALEAAGFMLLDDVGRDLLLTQVQAGGVAGWPISPALWFEEVLASLTQIAYGHPLLQFGIGYDGMLDARGFQDVDD